MGNVVAIEEISSNNSAVGDYQVGNRGPLGKPDALLHAGKGSKRTADFSAGCVAIGVQNAWEGVCALAGTQQLAGHRVKDGAPLDEFGHADRALGNQYLGGPARNDSIASVYRVFQVEFDVLFAFHGDRDAALRVVRVRLANRFLRDHQDITVASQFDRRTQAGHARPHYQKIHLR